jgi:hypothetical protein
MGEEAVDFEGEKGESFYPRDIENMWLLVIARGEME